MPVQTSPIQIDPLQDWPAHYYELTAAADRRAALEQALSQELDRVRDGIRMKYLLHRFYQNEKGIRGAENRSGNQSRSADLSRLIRHGIPLCSTPSGHEQAFLETTGSPLP